MTESTSSNPESPRQRPWLIAAGIALAVGLWLLSGQFGDPADAKSTDHAGLAVDDEALLTVQVRASQAEDIPQVTEIRGRTTPWAQVELAAETEGRVVEVFHEAGDEVTAGEPILKIDPRARAQVLEQARALRQQRESEYAASQRLFKSRHITETQLAQSRAAREAARADEKRAELDLAATTLRSPIDGFIEERIVDVGDYLKVGSVAARAAELGRLRLVAFVSEQDVANLKVGQAVNLFWHDGSESDDGIMHFVARTSDATTRTYRVEVEVGNPQHRPSGQSVRGHIQGKQTSAHRLPIGLLDLGDDGSLGILGLAEGEDTVRRYAVSIMQTEANDAWFSGLPERFRVITRGQGFVRDGDRVEAISEKG